jgi:rRNA maturation endonuclease Nob1
VSYATADGTATAPDYYTAVSGTLAFGSSQTSQTVTVNTNDLCRLNLTKLMYLNLSNATSGGGISDTQGVGSIQASGGGGCGGP